MKNQFFNTKLRKATAGLVLLGGLAVGGVGVAAAAGHLGNDDHDATEATAGSSSVEGMVVSLFANGVTISNGHGSTMLVAASPTTTFSVDDHAASGGAVVVGSTVEVDGTAGVGGAPFQATHIDVSGPESHTDD